MIFVAIYVAIGLVSGGIWFTRFPAKERDGAALAWSVVAGGLFWPIGALFAAIEVWQEEFLLAYIGFVLAVVIVVVLVALARR